MADHTHIEWTDATWNPVTGCSVLSPGCAHCYAMKLAGTRLQHHPSRAGLTRDTKAGPVWTGEVRFNETWLDQPLRWRRPRRIFVCAHGDLFHEDVPDAWIDSVFAVMALAPQHSFQVLTKRAARMRAYLSRPGVEVRIGLEALGFALNSAAGIGPRDVGAGVKIKGSDINPGALVQWPLPNVWLGVSAEDQVRLDERRGDFEACPAAVKFVSYEPALGPVDWTGWEFVDQIISGGENGPRPSHPDWHRATRDFCGAHGIAYFFKQWGTWAPRDAVTKDARGWRIVDGQGFCAIGKKKAGRLLDGVEHNGFPEPLNA